MREWIITNGLGGYASLTHRNTNTRKYHGLLISSLNPPTERYVFLSNILDKIKLNNRTLDLTQIKNKFSFDYFPRFQYDFLGLKIKKTFFMPHGKNTIFVKYDIKTKQPFTITHTPMVNFRHLYDVNKTRNLDFIQDSFKDWVCVRPKNIENKLKILVSNSNYNPSFYWQELYYEKDHERQDSWIDNNAIIGNFTKKITKNTEYYIFATLENEYIEYPSKIYKKEKQHKKNMIKKTGLNNYFNKLILSADDFIVNKADSKTIIAGYHWFGDWGRDAFISLPGLTLVTKRFKDAEKILRNFAGYCKNGLIPNAFMERDSKAVYNTVDASLWFIDRVYQYLKYTNDKKFLKQIWRVLDSIIEGYKNGTEYDIHMDEDYLISHGPGLTWMDVKLGDFYPTPRSHKAVEIQALWYNALCIMSDLSQILKKQDKYQDLASNVKDSFNRQYDALYDVVDTKDNSVRPNMIFLVSLDHTMIDLNLQKIIVKEVQDKLLTVFGVRTLSADHPDYKGHYIGNYDRDFAYHNGTVWPWLMGPFVKSFVKIRNFEEKSRKYAYENFLAPMFDVFGEQWDGSIPEIFDGEPVYIPRGCINQAWSVSEILRCWVEDIEKIRPKYEKNFVLHEISV